MLCSLDLETALDRYDGPLREADLQEWLVQTVLGTQEGTETAVRTGDGLTDWFKIPLGLHQVSLLIPLLFILVMEAMGSLQCSTIQLM